jgi:hypothetical protein
MPILTSYITAEFHCNYWHYSNSPVYDNRLFPSMNQLFFANFKLQWQPFLYFILFMLWWQQNALFGCKDIKKLDHTGRIEGWYSKSYRKVPTSTTAIILRKIIELDQQRAKLLVSMSFDKNEKDCINGIPKYTRKLLLPTYTFFLKSSKCPKDRTTGINYFIDEGG